MMGQRVGIGGLKNDFGRLRERHGVPVAEEDSFPVYLSSKRESNRACGLYTIYISFFVCNAILAYLGDSRRVALVVELEFLGGATGPFVLIGLLGTCLGVNLTLVTGALEYLLG